MTPLRTADLVLLGGTVVTMSDAEGASADAAGLAVSEGRIVALGDAADMERLIGAQTRVIDLGGATVLPGFTDSHIHPVFGLDLTRGADLSGCRDLDEVRERLRAELGTLQDGEWLLGWGLDPNVFAGAEVSGRFLDDLAPRRPALVRLFDAHAALASSEALRIAEVDGTEKFSDASRIVLDSEGRPTGYLLEVQAIMLVEKALPSLGFDDRVEALYELLLHMARAGFTAGQVQDLAPEAMALLEAIERTRDLPIRLRMSPWFVPGAPLEEEVERLVTLQGTHGQRWKVEGVKLMIDGTIDNGTAWLHEPDCFGQSTSSLWLDPGQYRDAIAALDAREVPTTTHAIGDAGIDFVVRALADLPPGTATHRIEHLETMTDESLAIFARSRATASMQPTHCTLFVRADGADNWSERLGAERAGRGFRMRDVIDAGIPLALGSDWPVAPSDAVGILADAQLRRPHDSPDVPPIHAEQALTALDALRGFTTEPHRSIGERGGMIEVGSVADLTVLDRDPRTTDPAELGDARVLLTVVEGRVVVDAVCATVGL